MYTEAPGELLALDGWEVGSWAVPKMLLPPPIATVGLPPATAELLLSPSRLGLRMLAADLGDMKLPLAAVPVPVPAVVMKLPGPDSGEVCECIMACDQLPSWL